MKVITIDEYDYEKVEKFLKTIDGIKIDLNVIKNASVLVDDNEEIVGLISFEVFGSNGLIRYFVFKKIIDEESLETLFLNLVKKAKEKKIKRLFSFVHNASTNPIFEFLGFGPINKNLVFIEEKPFTSLYHKDALVYCYEII